MSRPTTTRDTALAMFREHGGMLRTTRALELGIHPETLYRLRDSGELVQVSRGLYRLADLPPRSQPDLVAVATRIPSGVMCLISALSFHGITTEIPHEVQIAVPTGSSRRRIAPLPAQVPVALTGAFAENAAKQVQWRAFLGKSRLESDPLPEVVRLIADLVIPPTETVARGAASVAAWVPGAGWEPPTSR